MRLIFLILLTLPVFGCSSQKHFSQEPEATREVILGTEVSIESCNSYLFIPRIELGPDAICVNVFSPERSEDFGVDLSASSIAFDDEPAQQLVELLPENNASSNSNLLTAKIKRGHIARYSAVRDGVPRVIVLFPTDAVHSSAEQVKVSPIGTRTVSLELLFTYGDQQQPDQRTFTITSQREFYSLLDL